MGCDVSTVKIIERLVKEFPRKDLKPTQVFALDAAKEHLDALRRKVESKARLTDRDS